MPRSTRSLQVGFVNLLARMEYDMRRSQEPASAAYVPGHRKLLGQGHQAATREVTEQRWVTCPEADCDVAAEVIDRYTLHSTDGPVQMVRTRCISRHIRDSVRL
jgi:hypothetical protein